jgi:membrane protease YdiL (CAAX protease family)
MPAGARRVSIRAAAAMYLALLALSLAGIIVGVTGKLSPGDLDLGLAVAQAGIILAFAAALPRTLLPSRDGDSRPLAHWIALAPFIGLATFSIATVAVVSLNHAFNLPSRDDTSLLLDAGWGWDGVLVMIALMPAVFEEIAFRGVVQQALRPALSVREAIIVQALLFAILHLSAWSIPHLAVMGLTLGFLRARSGSLLPGMVVHFTHNGLCVLAAWMNAASS